MRNNQSLEDYLERILILKERIGNVRSIDLATDMSFSKPSISIAMKKLEEKGLVEVERDTGYLNLTEEGLKIAQKTYEKHCTLRDFFVSIGVTPEVAADDACKIEHDLSDETFGGQYMAKYAGAEEAAIKEINQKVLLVSEG